MFAALGLLFKVLKYREVIGLAIDAYKAFKEVKGKASTDKEERKARYKYSDYLAELKETRNLIKSVSDRKMRRKLRADMRATRDQVRRIGKLEDFDILQKRILEIKAEAATQPSI